MSEEVKHFVVNRVRGRRLEAVPDTLVIEEPLEIRLNNIPLAVVMRTPGHDHDLARGFLLTEGILQQQTANGKKHIASCGEQIAIDHARDELGLEIPNVVNCRMLEISPAEISGWQRHIFASSSCGICGRASIDRVRVKASPANGHWLLPFTVLQTLPEKLQSSQTTFFRTGGLHAAALFSAGGEIIVLREDVGRHNAVDKILGWTSREKKWPLENLGLLVSGRLSFELVQKALLGGITLMAGISAASSLAVELAEEAGMTLIGFLRGATAVVYSHPQRIQF
ncbi:MAG: Sulfur carrier protein FdhD [bacterium]|nr:Sulfur carrier protein FdhD [bacterium]